MKFGSWSPSTIPGEDGIVEGQDHTWLSTNAKLACLQSSGCHEIAPVEFLRLSLLLVARMYVHLPPHSERVRLVPVIVLQRGFFAGLLKVSVHFFPPSDLLRDLVANDT